MLGCERWGKQPGEGPGNPFAKPSWFGAPAAQAVVDCSRRARLFDSGLLCEEERETVHGYHGYHHGPGCIALPEGAAFMPVAALPDTGAFIRRGFTLQEALPSR